MMSPDNASPALDKHAVDQIHSDLTFCIIYLNAHNCNAHAHHITDPVLRSPALYVRTKSYVHAQPTSNLFQIRQKNTHIFTLMQENADHTVYANSLRQSVTHTFNLTNTHTHTHRNVIIGREAD
jgi:hypothetical protein